MPRFRISHVLWFVLTVGLALAWYVDRLSLIERIEAQNPPVSVYGFAQKFQMWNPSIYLNTDVTALEAQLLHQVETLDGSSQGIKAGQLGSPTKDVIDSLIPLLDSDDVEIRVTAARLLALHLHRVSSFSSLDAESFAVRVHFQLNGSRKAWSLLSDPELEVRGAAALMLGNTIYDRTTVRKLSDAFDSESDSRVKLFLAWAYWRIGNNYGR